MNEEDMSPSLERKRVVDTAWIFDVDGVITDIEKEEITEPLILGHLVQILERGEPIAFNTGRGIDWVESTVLNPLKAKISNQEILQNLFVVAESGGIQAIFNEDGSMNLQIDDSLKMPTVLDQKVLDLLQEKYSQSMRYEAKKTMITTKIKEGTSVEEFHKDQQEIAKDLQRLIDSYGFTDKFKVDISTIGTNIMHKTTGKDKGSELILEWISKRKIKPQRFIAFGDSIPDIPMAEKINEAGHPVELVYVGKNKLPKDNYPFKITRTQNSYDKGAVEFLSKI